MVAVVMFGDADIKLYRKLEKIRRKAISKWVVFSRVQGVH